jgi:Na+-transporting methylmalonyl-CoA/oxaloacetate decarboxylase gamma subunit
MTLGNEVRAMTRLCELLSNGTTGVVLGIAMMFLSIIGLITLIIGIYRLIAKPASGIYSEPDLLDRTDGDKPEYLNANEAPSVETDEIIAVISAAIATYLNRSTHSVVVRSIRRLPSDIPAWNRVARQEHTTSRL